MKLDAAYGNIVYRTAAILLAVLIATASLFAASLEEYTKRVEHAHMLALIVEEDPADDRHIDDLVRYVEQSFPASEYIDWSGGRSEASNQWLLTRNAELKTKKDATVRGSRAVEMREYLAAIIFKIHELKAVSAEGKTRDEEKQKLAEILRRAEYQKPEPKADGVIAGWLTRFLEWLESLFSGSGPTERRPGGSGMASIIQFIVFAAILGLLGYLAYRLLPLLVPSMRADRRKKKKKDRVILGEKIGDDATAGDLFDEAERLAKSGDLRGAIRKGYIALLCELADRKIIGLARHKTNRDYLRDVRSRRELHPRMKVVTDTFERHWYGYQDSNDTDWAKFRDDYREAIRGA